MSVKVIQSGLSIIIDNPGEQKWMLQDRGANLYIVDGNGNNLKDEYDNDYVLKIPLIDIRGVAEALMEFANANMMLEVQPVKAPRKR